MIDLVRIILLLIALIFLIKSVELQKEVRKNLEEINRYLKMMKGDE